MRQVIWSKSALNGLDTLLAQGLPKFGIRVAREKQLMLFHLLDTYLVFHPRNGSKVTAKPFFRYDVSNTPFADLYEFDDNELRVLFIIHKHQDTRRLNPSDVEW